MLFFFLNFWHFFKDVSMSELFLTKFWFWIRSDVNGASVHAPLAYDSQDNSFWSWKVVVDESTDENGFVYANAFKNGYWTSEFSNAKSWVEEKKLTNKISRFSRRVKVLFFVGDVHILKRIFMEFLLKSSTFCTRYVVVNM